MRCSVLKWRRIKILQIAGGKRSRKEKLSARIVCTQFFLKPVSLLRNIYLFRVIYMYRMRFAINFRILLRGNFFFFFLWSLTAIKSQFEVNNFSGRYVTECSSIGCWKFEIYVGNGGRQAQRGTVPESKCIAPVAARPRGDSFRPMTDGVQRARLALLLCGSRAHPGAQTKVLHARRNLLLGNGAAAPSCRPETGSLPKRTSRRSHDFGEVPSSQVHGPGKCPGKSRHFHSRSIKPHYT